MKLLYITQMYPSEELPQYCIFLHLQVKALIAQGAQMTVVVPTTERDSGQIVYDGVPVIYLYYRNYSRSILYPLVASQLSKELRRFCDGSEYDAVYAIHAAANLLDFARVTAQRAHKPLIVHYRGYNIFEEYNKEPKVLFSDPEKVREKVVKASALSIGVSRKTSEIITARFPDARTATVYNGVDTDEFSPSDNAVSSEKIHILCVANLIPIKGHIYLFNAVKEISQKHPNLRLVTDIVGRGSYEEYLKQYVREHQIPNVLFHGYVQHDEVARWMQSADIFTLPSVYESFGNVVLESMACRKPVLIFSGQGVDELIEDGVSGMIADKGDQADYTAKLEALLTDEALRKRIAQAGYDIARQYTWDRSAKCIISEISAVYSVETR